MVLGVVRDKTCPICQRRGDNIGREKLVEIKSSNQAAEINRFFENVKKREVNLNDIVCKKHTNYLKRNAENVNNTIQTFNANEVSDEVADENNNVLDENSETVNEGREQLDDTYEEVEDTQSTINTDICNDSSQENSIFVDLPQTYSSHSFCFICKLPSGMFMRSIIQLCASKDFYFNNTGTKPFKVISSVAKIDLLLTKNIFVKDGTRCCIDHFDEIGHILDKDASNIVVVHQNVSLTGQDILEFIASFRHRETQQSTLFNRFREINTFTDKLCKDHTGYSKDQLSVILQNLTSLKNSPSRSKIQALVVYLKWLRTGITQTQLSLYFGLPYRQNISNYCQQVREALINDFVPLYLGASHRSRDYWTRSNTAMVKMLFDMTDTQLCLVADGTYLYCQKSSNNKIQRQLHSVQKGRALIKPFVICTSDGYIVDTYGPYAAKDNDATILLHLLSSNDSLKNLVLTDDVFVLDRGFRDAVRELKQVYNLSTKLPTCKSYF